MIISSKNMKTEIRTNMRGGQGDISIRHLVDNEKIPYGRLLAKIIIPVGGSIGEHEHKKETEYYIILSGDGEVNDNGVLSTVTTGDVVITTEASHSIKNIGENNLEMIAIIMHG